MVLGFVLAAFILITCIMFFGKRVKGSSFQKWNHKIHKIVGLLALIISIVHMFLVWPLRLQRPVMMYVLGFIMIFLLVILVVSFYLRKKLGSSWRIIHRVAACGVILCLAGHMYLGIHSLLVYNNQVQQIEISSIELDNIQDGTYIGEENVGYIFAKVKVVVENHKMVSVDILEHRTERGKPAEKITEAMLQTQKNKVDAISSATNSSKVIMKAVEKALQKGRD